MSIEQLINDIDSVLKDNHERNGFTFPCATTKASFGKKYARIVLDSQGQRSAYAFVDMDTGEILLTDGWAKPSKRSQGKRGNIADPDSYRKFLGPYGMQRLR